MAQVAYNGAVEKALQVLGLDALLKPKAFCSALLDYAADCDNLRDIKVLANNADEALLRVLYDASSVSASELRLARGKVRVKLVDEFLLADAVADRLAYALADGVCVAAFGKPLEEPPAPKPPAEPAAKPASQPATKQAAPPATTPAARPASTPTSASTSTFRKVVASSPSATTSAAKPASTAAYKPPAYGKSPAAQAREAAEEKEKQERMRRQYGASSIYDFSGDGNPLLTVRDGRQVRFKEARYGDLEWLWQYDYAKHWKDTPGERPLALAILRCFPQSDIEEVKAKRKRTHVTSLEGASIEDLRVLVGALIYGYSSHARSQPPASAPAPAKKPSRDIYAGVRPNDPCPCGSGKKFKHCHGMGRSASAQPATAPQPSTAPRLLAGEPAEPEVLNAVYQQAMRDYNEGPNAFGDARALTLFARLARNYDHEEAAEKVVGMVLEGRRGEIGGKPLQFSDDIDITLDELAFSLATKYHERGCAWASQALVQMYRDGICVERDGKKSLAIAREMANKMVEGKTTGEIWDMAKDIWKNALGGLFKRK